ncbi:DUF6051 family protein [Myroides sp. LJL110]
MHYYQLHEKLKNLYNQTGNLLQDSELGIEILRNNFTSDKAHGILHGSLELKCCEHEHIFEKSFVKYTSISDDLLDIPDYSVKENLNFPISIMRNLNSQVSDKVIVMFHGLNEKKWDKYLPWAYELVKRTNSAVVLFPISFHMERTPKPWSDRKLMFEVANKRAQDPSLNSDWSYVNAAISTRMEADPLRMFWSGLQTFYDFIQWVENLRQGQYPSLKSDAKIDLFGYSIGSFLSIILKMANPKQILGDSKLVCFCGGMTIDRMFPVSKYIMDGKATIMMQKIFAQLLTTNFVGEPRLAHYQCGDAHPEESWFKAMLRYNHFQKEREQRLTELQDQIYSINLLQDEVAPAVEALNMLKGPFRDIQIPVEILDYPFNHTHMVPFPLTVKNAQIVDDHFYLTMQKMADFYNS